VAGDESIANTRSGVPVTDPVPPGDRDRPDIATVIAEWQTYRARHDITLDGITI